MHVHECPLPHFTKYHPFEFEKILKNPKKFQIKSEKKNHACCCAIECTLLSPDGNVSRVLRGGMPELAGAEEMAKAKKAWELIYKDGTTLKGNHPPETMARSPGTHLPGLSLTHSSLLQWHQYCCCHLADAWSLLYHITSHPICSSQSQVAGEGVDWVICIV